MRRWRGPVNHWTVELRLVSHDDDDYRLSSFLANLLDPVVQSFAEFVFHDSAITNNQNYVWISDRDEINAFNQRLRNSNTFAANMMTVNSLNVISIFTFVTSGPVGHALQPVK